MRGLLSPDPFKEKHVTKVSKKHEKRIAKKIGGKRQPASGAMYYAKGDIRSAADMTEHKYTAGNSYSVTEKVLRKVWMEAHTRGISPMLVITFTGLQAPLEKDWVLVPLEDLERRQS